MSEEVEYLGHIVTPQGLIPTKGNLDTIKEFPVPIARCETSETIFGSDLTFLKVHSEVCQDCSTFVL